MKRGKLNDRDPTQVRRTYWVEQLPKGKKYPSKYHF